jgi:xanthine dehydrogenase accessory factor
VLEGPDGIGSKLLLSRAGVLDGTLGSPEVDREIELRARELFAAGRSDSVRVAGRRVFIEVHLPPPRLVVVGAVHIASSLARFARELGFRVVVSDARGRFATEDRFPDVDELILGWPNEVLPRLGLDEFSYVVVITHDAKLDNPALLAALRSPAPYVGALGSRRTHDRRVTALREAGVTEEEISRIHAPIGLDIGARTPEEIALATMAEIVAVRNGAVSTPR